jgi:hypothetical protein
MGFQPVPSRARADERSPDIPMSGMRVASSADINPDMNPDIRMSGDA